MPRYLDILVKNNALQFQHILDFMLDEYSPFFNEGKNLLIEEFGKDYGTYFSIMELISVGKTARTEIESILETPAGGYLDRLENDYAVIAKHKPMDAKPNSRMQKYLIIDNFLNFWFRFIYRHRSAVETGNFNFVKQVISRDYAVYSGRVLESFFRELLADTHCYNRIGSYWEKGNNNEIDLVAVNDLGKKILLAEIKWNKSKINIETLKQKAAHLLTQYPDYTPQWLALSLDNAGDYL